MRHVLPTGVFGSVSITSFWDSLVGRLRKDAGAKALHMFFYAITLSGWSALGPKVTAWRKRKKGRIVTVFVGTDHGITDPDALIAMRDDGMLVRLMTQHSGVFHPKMVWLAGGSKHAIWVGSNNLTRDGLRNNIECAALIEAKQIPKALREWEQRIESVSTPITDDLVASYRAERAQFEKTRAAARVTTFTWSRRSEATPKSTTTRKGDLILEIMPEETRGGNQIQLPKEAVRPLLGLRNPGDQVAIRLKPKGPGTYRQLLVTVFSNNTVRLSLNELDYRDRPCVVVLRKESNRRFEFEIVSESVFPSRYRRLMAVCINQTRAGSRRWAIV